ncbi:MAG: MBL fold metallo-hydrolase [Thermodesulfobacteriota bacterium]|nr:MBL fold metallo-hydrolase [Thermodesulfobacteriota bacterium]
MRITLIYDNDVFKEGLVADWGFSCLVEIEKAPKILFDTGADGSILLSNMEKLDIDPASIDVVMISHPHHDHVGGLWAFCRVNKEAKVYVPPSLRGLHGIDQVIPVMGPSQILEGVFSTGELAGIEQSMAVKTDKGVVLIVGCSHPGMASILKAASGFGKVYAVVGGLHGFREYKLFEGLELICPTHCTQHKREIKALYPEQYIEGGAGQVIVL